MLDTIFDPAQTEQLYHDLRRANSEAAKKERFLTYVTNVFRDDAKVQDFIRDMAMGAETSVANITRDGRAARGRADSQTDTVIIEWERDLARTGDHAKEQLREYLEGNWRSGQEYKFTLLSTDGVRWRRYAPDWSLVSVDDLMGQSFQLREVQSFELAPSNFGEFPFFLDEVLFADEAKAATLENIRADFGDTSRAFINSMTALNRCLPALERQSELKVAYEQWNRFLSIAYGQFDNSPKLFLVHTYLSVFAKFIAYSVITKETAADDDTIRDVLSGRIFDRLNVERFVEDDFFHWVASDEFLATLRPMFREIGRQIDSYDFTNVREDILKGVYQELIDLETRHALGEYYTPDWLCERVMEELPLEPTSSILDPACGSGSFLRAAIARMREQFPDVGAEKLAEQVVGIDIHPLSVLIAKTTVLLSLGDSVRRARRPVTLHIYLANSLLVPRGTADLFESTFQVSVDNGTYAIDTRGVSSPEAFDALITFCDDLVDRYPEALPRERFLRLGASIFNAGQSADLPGQLYDIYHAMWVARDEGRDSIWKFILQNSYKPIFLMGRFDFVVGNPPWLTYAGVTNGDYQNLLRTLSDHYRVTPENRANFPHLEIAAIFLAHAVNYFMKRSGRLAFVLPRSFMSADQHEATRAGNVAGLRLSAVWDLNDVAPLFRVPCCVLFALHGAEAKGENALPEVGIEGYSVSGRLRRAQVHLSEARAALKWTKRRWHYSRLQSTKRRTKSALTATAGDALAGVNAYTSKFTQGATIVPRNFFFVDLDQRVDDGEDLRDRVLALKTAAAAEREAKKPWKGLEIRERAEGSLLFRTAISRNIVPFALVAPPLVLLPVVEEDGKFAVLDPDALMAKGFRFASSWFSAAEEHWNAERTERNAGNTLGSYLNWQSKLTGQNPRARYLVLYTSSATDASAVVLDRQASDHPFVIDHKAYWCETKTAQEAHYLAAFINSGYANEAIKEFQSRGLFGPRDIHKTIVKVPFPRFKASEADHAELARLGRACAAIAERVVKSEDDTDLQPRALGRIRSRIRREMADEMDMVDRLVERLSRGQDKSKAGDKPARPSKRRPRASGLFD
ncbi:N-6 DNA methylase [Aureimonas sp. SK2]|uniref:N-6 DNA methylase n=1 Tax=Aureimonas sp. SK2 TaxID=3015992 RepID=UPI002445040F|nr:N-6 DNA methylase [Aureimonas sp. SK2]